jgi:hypothetical protein
MSTHRVGFLSHPGIASLDFSGPAQALSVAGKGRYEVTLLSVQGGLIESDCLRSIVCDECVKRD